VGGRTLDCAEDDHGAVQLGVGLEEEHLSHVLHPLPELVAFEGLVCSQQQLVGWCPLHDF